MASEEKAYPIPLDSSPQDASFEFELTDLFEIEELQRLQDQFAIATGVASVITSPDGTPITSPSNFRGLCKNIIRNTPLGLKQCYTSDAQIGKYCHTGPTVQRCLSAGLWDAGAGISVGGRHIANWLIGQVRDASQTAEEICLFARQIGADEAVVSAAFDDVPIMSREQFANIANFLFTAAEQLSKLAFQNLVQTRQIFEQKASEEKQRRINRELHRASRATVMALANLAEFRDENTGDHVIRVALLAHEISRTLHQSIEIQVKNADIIHNDIGVASLLHDVGKVTIPDHILLKPTTLNSAERSIIQEHSEAGARILNRSNALAFDTTYLELAAEIALYHHERFDGTGYPKGIKGDMIPLSARIVAVADVFDALTHDRPYKQAWTEREAAHYLNENSGTQFDPNVVAAALWVLNERRETPGICWTNTMSVGNLALDHDHRILIDILNQMSSPANRLDRTVQEFVLDELLIHAVGHFSREEDYMRQSQFPDYERHKKVHTELIGEINAIREQFFEGQYFISKTIWNSLTTWLVQHIFEDDKKLSEIMPI